jgi:hypothetical protein
LLELKERGVVVEAGAFTDVSASIVLVRAESEEAALAVCRNDVYMRNRVRVEIPGSPVRQGGERRGLRRARRSNVRDAHAPTVGWPAVGIVRAKFA